MKKFTLLALSLFFYSWVASAQVDSLNIHNLTRDQIIHLSKDQLISLPIEDLVYLSNKLGVSMDELLNMQLTVSSKKQLTPRESPGIISVITHEEIIKSGARDLVDVLSLVPGISFGYDIDGVVGLGMRGNWGLEGKILVMLDGIELNEGMYGTVNFGNHFSPEQVEHIEVIRGPGSALYGGYAELGVINIVTRNAQNIDGVNVYATGGELKGTSGHRNAGFQIGEIFGKTELTISGFYGTGHRSEKELTDFNGDIYKVGDVHSKYESQNLNISLKHNELGGHFMLDDYRTHVIGYAEKTTNHFNNMLSDIFYKWCFSEKFELTPRIAFKKQLPYNMEDTAWFYRRNFYHFNPEVNFNYTPNSKLNLVGGVGYYYDYAKDEDNNPDAIFRNNKKTIDYFNYSVYAQGLYKLKFINIVAGGRFDYHNQAGSNFAPRIGITSVMHNFHCKLLLSKSFRTPSIENIDINPSILSERTTVIEGELGYKLNANMLFTANIFDVTIKNPIIYEYNPYTKEDIYLNYDKTGSRGIEFQYDVRYSVFSLNATYSFYNSNNKNTANCYKVFLNDGTVKNNTLQGMPSHKVTVAGTVNVTNALSICPSLVIWGKRYGYINADTVQECTNVTPILNFFVNYEGLLMQGFSLGIGVYNIFNENWSFIQPYATSENATKPYAASGREILVKISYNFGKRKM